MLPSVVELLGTDNEGVVHAQTEQGSQKMGTANPVVAGMRLNQAISRLLILMGFQSVTRRVCKSSLEVPESRIHGVTDSVSQIVVWRHLPVLCWCTQFYADGRVTTASGPAPTAYDGVKF